MLGRQPHCGRGNSVGAAGLQQNSQRADASALLRHPAASPAAPYPVDSRSAERNTAAAARSPQRWALRVSELTKSTHSSAAQSHVDSDGNEGVRRRNGDSPGNSSDQPRPAAPGFSTVSASALSHELLEQSVGASAPIWRVKEASDQAFKTRRKQMHDLYWHATAKGTAFTESDMAFFVCEFAKVNDFDAALNLMDQMAKRNQTAGLEKINHKIFLESAQQYKQSAAAVAYLHALPKRYHDIRLYNMVLQTCAKTRDVARAMEVMDLLDKHRVKKDVKLLTTMINVCKSVGNAEAAFKYFQEMKAANMKLDAQVYGTVVAACAEAMQRELSVVHERKDQYVLMERAFQLVGDAVQAGKSLHVAVYNSLLVCACRSGQLGRAFEVLDLMAAQKIAPDQLTYSALMEACLQARKQQLALKIFRHAVQQGIATISLYTQAVTACKLGAAVDLDKVLSIQQQMGEAGIMPDKKFHAAMLAALGKAGRLDLVMSHVQAMSGEDVVIGQTLANGLLHALQRDMGVMRQVYAYCCQHGVYPEVSQYNRLMDWYTEHGRFGEVVSLVCDMVNAGLVPNLNTFRIIFNACQKAGQTQLALEVYAAMKAKKIPIMQEKFARTIFHSLLKTCLNQILTQWAQQFSGKPTPWKASKVHPVRMAEAEKLLTALRSIVGSHSVSASGRATGHLRAGTSGSGPDRAAVTTQSAGRGAHGSGSAQGVLGTGLMALAPESINWQQQALMLFRDYVGTGYKPHLEVLDLVLRCLRLRLLSADDASGSGAAGAIASTSGSTAAMSAAGVQLVPGQHMAGMGGPATGSLGMPGGPTPLGLSGHFHQHHTGLGGALALGLPGTFGPAAARGGMPQVPVDFGGNSQPVVARQPWEVLSVETTSPSSSSPSSPASSGAAASGHGTGPGSPPVSSSATQGVVPLPGMESGAKAGSKQDQRYEMLFDRRAVSLLEEAMHRGSLPSVKGVEDGPVMLDLRSVPPTVAEVMLLSVLMQLDRRATKTGRCQVFHNITFVVPGGWEPDSTLWPSYVTKLNKASQSRRHSQSEDADADQSSEASASESHLHEPASASADGSAAGQRGRVEQASSSSSGAELQAQAQAHSSWDHRAVEASSPSTSADEHASLADERASSGNGAGPSSSSQAPSAQLRGAAALHGLPFSAADAVEALRSSNTQFDEAPQYAADTRTSLALLGMCRRMKVFLKQDPERGTVTLQAKELTRWLINRRQYIVNQQLQQQLSDDSDFRGAGHADARGSGRQARAGEATGSVDLRSSSDEDEGTGNTSKSGELMQRPKHRLTRKTKVRKPGSSSSKPGPVGTSLPVTMPTAVPISVPVPGSSSAGSVTGQVTVDGMTLGGGIHISVPSSKGENAQALA